MTEETGDFQALFSRLPQDIVKTDIEIPCSYLCAFRFETGWDRYQLVLDLWYLNDEHSNV